MSRSSKKWIHEHKRDLYVKQARQENYRSRAAYKLLQIQQKYRMIRPGDWVVDLGAAPGGWSQVAAAIVGRSGRVIAIDRLSLQPMPGVTVLQGDLEQEGGLDQLRAELGDRKADLLLSDMAPNTTGISSLDHDKSVSLADLVLELLPLLLRSGGGAVLKIFQGKDFQVILKEMRAMFRCCHVFKPPASRSRSVEVYLVGERYLGE
jgi:23S rRNA (uridine2552-2'-O)-methyltransferase